MLKLLKLASRSQEKSEIPSPREEVQLVWNLGRDVVVFAAALLAIANGNMPTPLPKLSRWHVLSCNLGVVDIVCLREVPTVPTKWPLVLIIEVHPGKGWKGMGHNSENHEGNIQAHHRQGSCLDASIVIETVQFGRRYVGAREKLARETERETNLLITVSLEILLLGKAAAAATFPRIYGRFISTRIQNFLGNLEAIRKYFR